MYASSSTACLWAQGPGMDDAKDRGRILIGDSHILLLSVAAPRDPWSPSVQFSLIIRAWNARTVHTWPPIGSKENQAHPFNNWNFATINKDFGIQSTKAGTVRGPQCAGTLSAQAPKGWGQGWGGAVLRDWAWLGVAGAGAWPGCVFSWVASAGSEQQDRGLRTLAPAAPQST